MNIHRIKHVIRSYYTLDNIVLAAAVLLAIGWVWGTMDTLQNNFRLQAQLNNMKQQVEINRIEADSLALENQYFASDEYLELQARERLGKALEGEHMLILPPNTVTDKIIQETDITKKSTPTDNFQAWLNFFFGNKSNS